MFEECEWIENLKATGFVFEECEWIVNLKATGFVFEECEWIVKTISDTILPATNKCIGEKSNAIKGIHSKLEVLSFFLGSIYFSWGTLVLDCVKKEDK